MTPDPDFLRTLDEFNRTQDAHVDVAVTWDHQKKRWIVWAVPTADSSHPNYDPRPLMKLARPLQDGTGRSGVKLFTWARYDETGNDIGYLPLDGRLFDALRMADTYRSKDHFEETIKRPELQREIEQKQRLRDIAYGARSYWWGINKTTSGAGSRGDWRWRVR